MSSPVKRRRSRLSPDPTVRQAILSAAAESVRTGGIGGLSVAAVLERAQLSTRAFYRHFDSKDQLVAEVFLDMARVETRRLRKKMAKSADPVEAVAAWIDGRLDLAFDPTVKSDLRRLSLEAQSQIFASPGVVAPAYAELLEPLVNELHRGLEQQVFHGIDPASAARSIQGVVWASTERHWATQDYERRDVREQTLRFCLRGLGVAPETITHVTAR